MDHFATREELNAIRNKNCPVKSDETEIHATQVKREKLKVKKRRDDFDFFKELDRINNEYMEL